MRKSNTSFKYVSFVYDFAVDTGAVAPYNTGVFISAGSTVVGGFITGLTTGVSGGGGTYIVGWTGTLNGLITASPANTIVAGTVVTTNIVTAYATPLFFAATQELVFSIVGAVFTAGKAVFTFGVVQLTN